MELEFEQQVLEFVRAQGLFAQDEGVMIAVSGGADSTALMVMMNRLRERHLVGERLICVHVHHGLRAEQADADEAFARETANRFAMQFVKRAVDVKGCAKREKMSIETAGRRLRLEVMEEVARQTGCSCVVTGHHKDDCAETMIQRLSRGTGYRGLCGIRPSTEFAGLRFARPLLCVRRAEIETYLRELGMPWQTDSTNTDCGFRRNFIRHRLLPYIERTGDGDLTQTLWELSRAAQSLDRTVAKRIDAIWNNTVEVKDNTVVAEIEAITALSPIAQVEMIRRCLVSAGCGLRDVTEEHYERMRDLMIRNESGRSVELPGWVVARTEYGRLVFMHSDEMDDSKPAGCVKLDIGGQARFGNFVIEAKILACDNGDLQAFRRNKNTWVERFDADAISGDVTVRKRLEGDRFQPLGVKGHKKIGQFLTNQKVPVAIRRNMLIFADKQQIIWVCPVRMSETAKITKQTRRILEIRVRRLD